MEYDRSLSRSGQAVSSLHSPSSILHAERPLNGVHAEPPATEPGSTFAVDHLELTGLRQAGWAGARESTDELEVTGLHALVRHPLMTGLLLAFWVTPDMGASHLLFALASSGYIAVGVMFEERDLRRTFGESYEAYAAHVPALLPRLPRRRDRARSLTA